MSFCCRMKAWSIRQRLEKHKWTKIEAYIDGNILTWIFIRAACVCRSTVMIIAFQAIDPGFHPRQTHKLKFYLEMETNLRIVCLEVLKLWILLIGITAIGKSIHILRRIVTPLRLSMVLGSQIFKILPHLIFHFSLFFPWQANITSVWPPHTLHLFTLAFLSLIFLYTVIDWRWASAKIFILVAFLYGKSASWWPRKYLAKISWKPYRLLVCLNRMGSWEIRACTCMVGPICIQFCWRE